MLISQHFQIADFQIQRCFVMESRLKSALNVTKLKPTRFSASGCINEGRAYETENGLIFVKQNSKSGARVMFDGELESLKALHATHTVKVPQPFVVIDDASGAVIAMEYVEMSSLRKYSEILGEQLAKMHLHNESLKNSSTSVHSRDHGTDAEYNPNFGFHVTTCCGYIPQDNSWKADWVEFFCQQRLEKQLQLVESNYGDREAMDLWSHLKLKIPSFFRGLKITPALLHGDLWSGNVAETSGGPVIYDPATFYGHSEYELGIASMFGGFPRSFYSAYHKLLPKQEGFEKRSDLYQLFHYLNHWNHFGGGYKGSSLSVMRQLIKDN